MDLDQITTRIVKGGVEYTIVRPGISLCLLYGESAVTLAPAVARILEQYIRFVPPASLQTYLTADGTWKKMNSRTLDTTLRTLRSISPDEYAEFHFGQEPVRNVGDFGAHFYAGPLEKSRPTRDAALYLEFPADVTAFTLDQLVDFVRAIACSHPFDSGHCGYAFKNLQMSLRREAFKAIGRMAMRYIGFDVSNDLVRLEARGRVCNVSWLTLLGREITAKLGGVGELRRQLADAVDVAECGTGTVIRATSVPIVGDVNRGAKEIAMLRRLAEITRSVRVEADNLGPDDPNFAHRWLNRFEALEVQ